MLQLAREHGLRRITTKAVQLPSDQNGHYAAVEAEIETNDGTFTGIGDATPENVNKHILPHLLRMAETRAKARAMRDAVGIDMVAFEELAGTDDILGGEETSSASATETPTREIDKDPSDVVVNFGKHKGKTLGQILVDKEGASYILWLAENAQTAAVKKAAQALKGKAETMIHQK